MIETVALVLFVIAFVGMTLSFFPGLKPSEDTFNGWPARVWRIFASAENMIMLWILTFILLFIFT